VAAVSLALAISVWGSVADANGSARPAASKKAAGKTPARRAPVSKARTISASTRGPTARPVRKPTEWDAPSGGPKSRDRGAKKRRKATVRALFRKAGVRWPPRQMMFRAYKAQEQLEVWAAGKSKGPLQRVATYEICMGSGVLGPKRRQGDEQVPEGFYELTLFNSASSYHLSMKVSYPNASDRKLGRGGNLGGLIMIHGDCVSIGCLAMSDERIEELWVMARSTGRPTYVHIFPSRRLDALLKDKKHRRHHAFWRNLKQGHDLFERTKQLPRVSVDKRGRYRFKR